MRRHSPGACQYELWSQCGPDGDDSTWEDEDAPELKTLRPLSKCKTNSCSNRENANLWRVLRVVTEKEIHLLHAMLRIRDAKGCVEQALPNLIEQHPTLA